VELHAEKKSQAGAPIIVELASLVAEIRELTARRNAIFHAHISSTIQGHVEYRSARTGKPVDVSTGALSNLVQDCVSVLKQTHGLMRQFMTELQLDTKQVSFLP